MQVLNIESSDDVCSPPVSLVPRPIPSFSMLHAEKREGPGLGCEIT